MRYLSVCSGIEAASVAWHHLGWQPVGFSEIEPFPSAVLAHHYPNVPNFGDMTRHAEWPLGPGSVDILVGGTPCQSFSVAGLRRGLSDPRGGLMLTYLEIAQRLRPRWIVWENVPGVLSSGSGRDLGSFLGALGELGYGWAYRVLDAQWVRTQRHPRAVPQRRRRVFVVGCLAERGAGDWERAAQVLFERESVQRHSASRRAQGEGSAADAESCAGTVSSKWAKGTGGPAGDECYNLTTQHVGEVSGTIAARFGKSRNNHEECVAQPVAFRKSRRAQSVTDHETWVAAEQANTLNQFDTGERDTHAVAFHPTQDPISSSEISHALGTGNRSGCATAAVAYGMATTVTPKFSEEVQPTITVPSPTGGGQPPAVAQAMTVRRLTPRECERLQGFPDDWTMIPWRKKPADDCPDGPRYKSLGNSMAVNVMAWIGERIAGVEARSAGNP